MTDHIIVMYAGKVFEQAPTRELFAAPGNPYTKGLLKSVPDPLHAKGRSFTRFRGCRRMLRTCRRAARSRRAATARRTSAAESFRPSSSSTPEHIRSAISPKRSMRLDARAARIEGRRSGAPPAAGPSCLTRSEKPEQRGMSDDMTRRRESSRRRRAFRRRPRRARAADCDTGAEGSL